MNIKNIITIFCLTIAQINCMEAPESELSNVPSLVFSSALQLAKNGQTISIDQVGDESLLDLVTYIKAIFDSKILSSMEKELLFKLINHENIDVHNYFLEIKKIFPKYFNLAESDFLPAILNNILLRACQRHDLNLAKLALSLGAHDTISAFLTNDEKDIIFLLTKKGLNIDTHNINSFVSQFYYFTTKEYSSEFVQIFLENTNIENLVQY